EMQEVRTTPTRSFGARPDAMASMPSRPRIACNRFEARVAIHRVRWSAQASQSATPTSYTNSVLRLCKSQVCLSSQFFPLRPVVDQIILSGFIVRGKVSLYELNI